MILILTQDMMMSSSASAIARKGGKQLKTVGSVTKLNDILSAENSDSDESRSAIELVLVDLQMAQLDLSELTQALNAIPDAARPRAIAYAQHVNVEILEGAKSSGFDEVITRGQMNSRLESLIG